MSLESDSKHKNMKPNKVHTLQQKWLRFLIFGIALIVLGAMAITFPLIATLTIELIIGCILVIGGIAHVIHAFGIRAWSGFFSMLLAGILYLIFGIMMLASPLIGVLTITFLLTSFLIAEGIFKIVIAFQLRPLSNWGWVLFGGIAALLLGFLIWAQWPSSAVWVIGLFVGVDIIFTGWAMVLIALTLHSVNKKED